MKKIIIALVVLAAGIAAYKYIFKAGDGQSKENTPPLEISGNTSGFSADFEKMISQYTTLRDAFVKGDTMGVNAAGATFLTGLGNLNTKDLKADTVLIGTAETLKQSILTETGVLTKVAGIEEKRKSFQIISDALYDLIRTVKYDKSTVYQINCPMAFNNTGANWLSLQPEVVNPYFGDKMLNCGSVVDSVNYRPIK